MHRPGRTGACCLDRRPAKLSSRLIEPILAKFYLDFKTDTNKIGYWKNKGVWRQHVNEQRFLSLTFVRDTADWDLQEDR